ncbi:MAG TPA: hypothetical protein VJH92_05240 [Candidatus Nanoarchaeia archaeon]|nr:hypothetical protein [Candidatus Nanoarchaeia archaeon]
MNTGNTAPNTNEKGPWNPDSKVLEELVSYLSSRPDQNARVLALFGKSYNPLELTDEVKNGTDAGRKFYSMYVRHKGLKDGSAVWPA